MLKISAGMKKRGLIFILTISSILLANTLEAQCSICTKTAQQLGEKPAKGMNTGILYLAFIPFGIVGFIGYRWWKGNQQPDSHP